MVKPSQSSSRKAPGSGTKSPVTADKKSALSPKSASQSYHHGDLRNALITEGRRQLEEVGPNELSLRSVARAVGVSIAAPSHHFKGKEDLLAAIASDGFHELAAERRRIAATITDPILRVYRTMECYIRFAEREKGLFYLMIGPRLSKPEVLRTMDSAVISSYNLFASAVSDYARSQGWAEADLELVWHAAWAVEHGIAMLILAGRVPQLRRGIEVERMLSFSLLMLLNGIAAGPERFARIENQIGVASTAMHMSRNGSAPSARRRRSAAGTD